MKHLWKSYETLVKHCLKHCWKLVKHWQNTDKTLVKHWWNIPAKRTNALVTSSLQLKIWNIKGPRWALVLQGSLKIILFYCLNQIRSPPNAGVAAMTSMQTNNFEKLLKTFETLSKHFWNSCETLLNHLKNAGKTLAKYHPSQKKTDALLKLYMYRGCHYWNKFVLHLRYFLVKFQRFMI